MGFEKLRFHKLTNNEMFKKSKEFLQTMERRRTVRDFSNNDLPVEIIKNCIKTAITAPSGANKQPWHFVIIKDPKIKSKIRKAAEKEEKEFYSHRATKEWLEDLNQFGTNWKKEFIDVAPYIIVVFKKKYDVNEAGEQKKNYYVNESVGIASGLLLTALHNAGLATLTHTPSPMGFLSKILNRAKNETPYLLIPVGYPDFDAKVPIISKKTFNEVCNTV